MNPKAILSHEMFGVKSDVGDDWVPGIFSVLWTRYNVRTKP